MTETEKTEALFKFDEVSKKHEKKKKKTADVPVPVVVVEQPHVEMEIIQVNQPKISLNDINLPSVSAQ